MTLTLKKRLKACVVAHRRSVNSEAIVCLERALLPGSVSATERIERARILRSGLLHRSFEARDIALFKHEGRLAIS